MHLIVGGQAQGKRAYCKAVYGVSEESFSSGRLDGNYVCDLEAFVRAAGECAEIELETYLEKYPDALILCREVGCGPVPTERSEREVRDRVGRICQMLAARAERVVRVVCGLGEVLK